MNLSFPETLTKLRTDANLTNRELAELANVPRSLIAGLQSGKRKVGEIQARRIAIALGLEGRDLHRFVMQALDSCANKVLAEFRDFPASVLNGIIAHFRERGIEADIVREYEVNGRLATNEELVERAGLVLVGNAYLPRA